MPNVLGLPVEDDGYDHRRTNRTVQWGVEEFEDFVKPLLDAGVSVRWEQYTPYFNDGDVCEFSLGDVRFKVDESEEGGDEDDGWFDTYDVQIAGGEEVGYQREYTGGTTWSGAREYNYVREPTGVVFEKHAQYDTMKELSRSMNHFEDLLYDLFGDHAQVTITPEKIIKESYEHE